MDGSVGAISYGNAKIMGKFWPKIFPSNFQPKTIFYKIVSKMATWLKINIIMLDYMF